MEILIKIFEFIIDVLTWAPVSPDGVELAIGPLAILAGGAVLGGINYIAGTKERRRLRRREKSADSQMQTSIGQLDSSIGALNDRANAAAAGSNMSVDELYGDQIQTATDRAQAGQAGMGAQIAKALAAGGGDISGSMAATLQRLNASTNRGIKDIMLDFNDRTERRNLSERARADNLFAEATNARGNQFSALSGNYNNAANRSTQKATADKQFLMDSIGLGANVAAIGR